VVDVVVLDACVLYPAPLRDLLLQLAVTGLYQAKWTNQIHDEWRDNLLANRPDLTRRQLDRTQDLMNAAVPDCLVEGYQRLIDQLSLPDMKDRHVLAAAICAKASHIVTYNLKDFPALSLVKYNMEAVHPDLFLTRLIDRFPGLVIDGLRRCRARLRRPELSASQYITILEGQSLNDFVKRIQNHMEPI
jgi:predicted nucleic acid-binding protein